MRIVIDTNVVASGVFFGGKPQELLLLAINGNLETYVSKEIVIEYLEIIERLAKKYPDRPKKLPLEPFISSCIQIEPERKISVCRDIDDNKFLECALESKCFYVVSGDDDLLSLEKFENVEIITVAEFFNRLEK